MFTCCQVCQVYRAAFYALLVSIQNTWHHNILPPLTSVFWTLPSNNSCDILFSLVPGGVSKEKLDLFAASHQITHPSPIAPAP